MHKTAYADLPQSGPAPVVAQWDAEKLGDGLHLPPALPGPYHALRDLQPYPERQGLDETVAQRRDSERGRERGPSWLVSRKLVDADGDGDAQTAYDC